MQINRVFPGWVWMVYLALFSLSIPWYLPSHLAMNLVFGLPLWLVSCILAVVVMAIFTVIIVHKYWKD